MRDRANGKKIPQEVLRQSYKKRALVFTVAVLTIAVALGVFAVVSAAVSRFGWKIDLTENQIFQLTDTTKQMLDALEQPVKITYCNPKSEADSNIREILNRYQSASAYIETDYLDLDANPASVEEWSRRGVTLSPDGVLVVCGDNIRFIQWNDLYAMNSYTDQSGTERYSLTGLQAESKLTAAIVAVTTAGENEVVFTAGHSEDVSQALSDIITDSNYSVQQVVLGVQELKSTVSTIIVAGPKRDFSEKELQILDEFMARGGNLIVFREPQTEVLPNLDGYLRSWGFNVENQIVLEPRQQMDSPLNIIPNFGVSMINVHFSEQSTYLVLPQCRAISLSSPNGCLTNSVLYSTTESYGKDYASMTALTQDADDAQGPFIVAATSERNYTDAGGEAQTQYVFLTACTGIYQDAYLQMESLGNADLILQVLAYINNTDVVLNIPVKRLSAGEIAISRQMTMIFAAVFVAAIPLLLLLAGAVMFLKRRRT